MFWLLGFFEAQIFWGRHFVLDMYCPLFLRSTVAENGKWVLHEHKAMVRGLVPSDRLLEWCVEDGYEPLCAFLGKEIPSGTFPMGNTPTEFAQTVAEGLDPSFKRAFRRMLIAGSTVLALGALAIRAAITA